MRRYRRLLALVCVAILAFAAVVPADGAPDTLAFLVPVWFEFQPDDVVLAVPVDSVPAAERSVSLRSLTAFRAPPSAPSA